MVLWCVCGYVWLFMLALHHHPSTHSSIHPSIHSYFQQSFVAIALFVGSRWFFKHAVIAAWCAMGLLGELPPLRFGTWGHAKKGCRQPLALSKPRQTQPLARARTGGSRSVSVLAQKRKLVDKVSAGAIFIATGRTTRRSSEWVRP